MQNRILLGGEIRRIYGNKPFQNTKNTHIQIHEHKLYCNTEYFWEGKLGRYIVYGYMVISHSKTGAPPPPPPDKIGIT